MSEAINVTNCPNCQGCEYVPIKQIPYAVIKIQGILHRRGVQWIIQLRLAGSQEPDIIYIFPPT